MTESQNLTEEDVCARVRDSVLEQRLAPGTKLTEESLCSVFGVGRTTIRRAFLLLKNDNIIELHKNRGAVVASPSPEAARQVFESRCLIEKSLLEKTGHSVNSNSIQGLRDHLAEEKAALETREIAKWIRLTGEFHLRLAALSGNELMCDFLKQLVFQTSLIVALYGPSGTSNNCNGSEHHEIVNALEAGNMPLAVEFLLTHLNEIEEQLVFEPGQHQEDLTEIFAQARTA